MKLYQIYFYVPENALEKVKNAMFIAGAGKFGDYQECAWQTKGTGQFKPSDVAKPHIGTTGQLSKLSEFRVEMICSEVNLKKVLTALKEHHPYQEVAYGAIPITTLQDL